MEQLQAEIDQKNLELNKVQEDLLKYKSDYRMLSDSFYRLKNEKEECKEYIEGLEQKIKGNAQNVDKLQ